VTGFKRLTTRRPGRPWLAISIFGLLLSTVPLTLLVRGWIHPSRSPAAITPTAAVPTISPTPVPSATPTPTPPPSTYVIRAGDTLWDIALRLDIGLDAILAVNPGLNPDLPLMPGVVLVLPGSDVLAATIISPVWPFTAQVTGGGALNLRAGPGLNTDVIVMLNPLTPLTVIGRTSAGDWLEVQTAYQTRGWVYALYTDVFVDLQQVPVVLDPEVQPVASPTGSPAPDAASTPVPTPDEDILSGITERAHEIFRNGIALGNRPNVFSKVGDSITVSSAFLTAIGQGRYNLDRYAYLQDVIDYYSEEWARTHNSFANFSLAARVGWWAERVVSEGIGDPDYCRDDETPLECEYRWVRPSVALILLGTNDVPSSSIENFSDSMRRVIEISISHGVIPVLSTIPPMGREGAIDRVDLINAEISSLARQYEIPLWDYHAALQGLPDSGLGYDGVHPSWAPRDHTADFAPEYLHYGMTVRSLTALQVLDEIWRAIIRPELGLE
jgi:LysM repeat protein